MKEINIKGIMSLSQDIRTHDEMALDTHKELEKKSHMWKVVPVAIAGKRPQPIIIEVSI